MTGAESDRPASASSGPRRVGQPRGASHCVRKWSGLCWMRILTRAEAIMSRAIRFSDLVEMIDRLPLDQREGLLDVVRKRVADDRRRRLAASIRAARGEHAARGLQACHAGCVDPRDLPLSYILLRSSAFVRDAAGSRRHPEFEEQLLQTLQLLEADPQAPRLKSHKLKGKLKASWACSAGYDLRVVFSFTKHGGKPAILLETIGTHDEVY